MADWLFWVIAAVVALGSLGLVFRPLLRGRADAGGRARYDVQVIRDQLREIEADRARGILTAAEAVEYGLIDEVVSTRKTAGIAATGGQAGR